MQQYHEKSPFYPQTHTLRRDRSTKSRFLNFAEQWNNRDNLKILGQTNNG